MKVCVIGCGFLGLTTACAMAEIGHDVYCIDSNDYKISNLQKGIIDFYEPNLREVVLKNIQENRLKFILDLNFEHDTDVYMIALGEKDVKNVVSKIVDAITKYCVIIINSTLSVGCINKIKAEMKNATTIDYDIVFNPQFISKGSALDDILRAKNVVVGSKSEKALDVIKELYQPITSNILAMNEATAEMTKLAYDSFMATKISYVNEIANLSAKTNVEIKDVLNVLENIGQKPLVKPSLGFDGIYLKSVDTILNLGNKNKVDLKIIKSAKIANENQKRIFLSNILKVYNYNIQGKTFCLWGDLYKQSVRGKESLNKTIMDTLNLYGATVSVYDPCFKNQGNSFKQTKEEALLNSDALIILDKSHEFENPDFEFISNSLTDKIIFDAQRMYLDKNLGEYNLQYYYIGKENE